MNHEKTFAAIKKLQEVEIELHRLKNALEMANKREWVGLTDEERDEICLGDESKVRTVEALLKEKNT
jgi:hypothetical protein